MKKKSPGREFSAAETDAMEPPKASTKIDEIANAGPRTAGKARFHENARAEIPAMPKPRIRALLELEFAALHTSQISRVCFTHASSG